MMRMPLALLTVCVVVCALAAGPLPAQTATPSPFSASAVPAATTAMSTQAPSSPPTPTPLPPPTSSWTQSEYGEIGMIPMKNAPYPHSSREDGWKTKSRSYPRDPHYVDNTVGIVIPPGYVPKPEVDLIIHFHGHLNYVSRVLKDFHLPRQLALARRNAIVLCPQGPREAGDSGCGKLEDPDGLKRFVDESMDVLRAAGKIPAEAKLRHLILSGHSGGYKVIGQCLKHGGMEDAIREVWLWDATYAQLPEFAAWLGRRQSSEADLRAILDKEMPTTGFMEDPPLPARHEPQGQPRRLMSIYTAHLAGENGQLREMLCAIGVSFDVWSDQHFAEALGSDLPARFVATTLAHNNLIYKGEFFRQTIESARCLEPIPAAQ